MHISPGSSPLARGTLRRCRARCSWLGLIPARAGNTHSNGRWPARWGAHPRSRGEHSPVSVMTGNHTGSSPLARGTRGANGAASRARGLIPARAGNTAVAGSVSRGAGAHPRSRGEHMVRFASVKEVAGSSPLARGTLPCRTPEGGASGLIPARAGNTVLPGVAA